MNGFFSSAEIAIISSKRSVIDKLAKDGNRSASLVREMKEKPDRFLATVQVGVTFVSTLASVIGGVVAVEALKPVYASVPYAPVQNSSELLAITTVVIVISYAMLVIGELAPKSLALKYSERIACFSARPLRFISKVAAVFVYILTASTSLVLKLFGLKGGDEGLFVSEEEIKYFINEGRAKGIFEETEAQLLHGVFEFADTTVEEVMVPKPKIRAIEINTPKDEFLKFISDTGFSRYPVYRGTLDDVVGVIFNKDVFKAMESGRTIRVEDLTRTPYFVPSSIMISGLLREMQRRHVHIAIVVDEHGDVDGLVTIEDLLEEIVGEIEDEYDLQKDGLVEKMKDGTLIIDASASLRDLTGMDLPFDEADEDEYSTIAGFMLSKLQRIPRGGEFVLHEGCRFTVVDMEGNRIAKIKVEHTETGKRTAEKSS